MSERKKRGNRLLTCGVAVLVVLGVVLLSALAWRQSLVYRLNTRLAEIRAAGDPATAEDLAPAAAPAGANAAAVLDNAAAELEAFSAAYTKLDQTEVGDRVFNDDAPTRLSAADTEALAQFLEPHGAAIAAVDAAAACDRYATTVDFSAANLNTLQQRFLDNIQRRRNIGRLNPLRTQLLLSQGKREEAAEVALASLKLSRFVRQEPTILGMLMGVALHGMAAEDLNRVLRDGDVSERFRERLNAELALNDNPAEFVRVLKQERAFSQTQTERLAMVDLGQVSAWRLGMLEFYDELLAVADLPWHEGDSRIRGIQPPGIDVMGGGAALQQSVAPAVESTYTAHNRMIALTRCVRVLNAITAAEAAGQDVEGLDDLPLPEGAATDPFTGERLIVDRRDNGWWVYSVMKNQTDDGGEFDDVSDYGLRPYSQ